MSAEDDVPVTIDDVDVSSVEAAVESLLDKTQAYLGFPYLPTGGQGTPSATLDYQFSASISVSLDTDWAIFSGLTLTNISLQTALSKEKDVPGQLLSMALLFFPRLSANISFSGPLHYDICHCQRGRYHI